MTDDLTGAVEELYRVFAPYRRTPMDEYCPCCVNEDEYARLVDLELRDVTREAIDQYMCNAIFTWGNVNGFKRFLPRIYEVLAFERHGAFSASGMWSPIKRLTYAHWQDWPTVERDVIERYLDLLWLNVLDGKPSPPGGNTAHDADDIFDGLAIIFDDVQPFIDVWREKLARSLGAAERFAEFVRLNDDFLLEGKPLGYGEWTAGADAMVREWLRDPSLVRALDNWLFDCDDDAIFWRISEAIDVLESYRERR